jgi:hypothetical protein
MTSSSSSFFSFEGVAGVVGVGFFAVADVLDFASMGSFVPNGSSEWFILDFLRGHMLAKIAAVW